VTSCIEWAWRDLYRGREENIHCRQTLISDKISHEEYVTRSVDNSLNAS